MFLIPPEAHEHYTQFFRDHAVEEIGIAVEQRAQIVDSGIVRTALVVDVADELLVEM